jgi:hypothetical protein
MRFALVSCLAAAGLFVPAGAAAKVTCESRGVRTPSIDLSDVPLSPVVGRTYAVRLVTDASALNPRPALATVYCGAGHHLAATTPADGWFRRVARGVYDVRVRFPRAGSWAISVMDLDGSFHDLGRRIVRRRGDTGARVPHGIPGPPMNWTFWSWYSEPLVVLMS